MRCRWNTLFLVTSILVLSIVFAYVQPTATAQTETYQILGYVKTASGEGIGGVVMDGLPGSPVTYSGGFYAAEVSAGWNGVVTPQKDGYSFTPASRTYTNVTEDRGSQNYTGALNITIMGYVKTASGEGIGGVVMDGLPGSPVTYSGGFYSVEVPGGWSGTVTPQKNGYSFSPSSRAYTNATEDQLNQDFSGGLTVMIVGYVKTAGGEGIGDVVMDGLPGSPTTYSGGFYAAEVPAGWSGTVTPQKYGYIFTPSNLTYTNVTEDQPDQNVTGEESLVQIVGYVKTASGAGIGDVVMDGLPGTPTTYSGGFYLADVPVGWSGTVTPQKYGYTFTPADNTYTNVTEDQPDQNFTGQETIVEVVGYVKDSSGAGIGGVVLDGLPGTPTTYSGGFYAAEVPIGWSGTVTALKSGYSFTPSDRTYSNVTSDKSDENYTGGATVRIVGYVTTSDGAGIGDVVMNGLPGTPTTYSGGYYSDVVPSGWSGTVTPEKSGYSFTPASLNYSNLVTHQFEQNYTGAVALAGSPTLINPYDSMLTNSLSLTLQWTSVTDATSYEIQFDDDPNFLTPDHIFSTSGATQKTVSLPDGTWYWRVRGVSTEGLTSAWSTAWSVTKDTIPPETPTLLTPANDSSTIDTTPELTWSASTGAEYYEIWLYEIGGSNLPFNVGNTTSYVTQTLPLGTYEWQVRATDAAGNPSFWSTAYRFSVTEDDPEPQVTQIEAESPTVLQTGTWTTVDSDLTSNGQYVMSSGQSGETLRLDFTGERVNVVYVQGAALGTFIIELDGVAMLTVDSAERQDDSFTEQVSISVNPGDHVLRIVANSGVVALDLFEITSTQ